MKYLHGTSNLWEWELDTRIKNDGHRILDTESSNIIQACHLFKKGKLQQNWCNSGQNWFQDSESTDEAYAEDKVAIQQFLAKWKSEGVIQL